MFFRTVTVTVTNRSLKRALENVRMRTNALNTTVNIVCFVNSCSFLSEM